MSQLISTMEFLRLIIDYKRIAIYTYTNSDYFQWTRRYLKEPFPFFPLNPIDIPSVTRVAGNSLEIGATMFSRRIETIDYSKWPTAGFWPQFYRPTSRRLFWTVLNYTYPRTYNQLYQSLIKSEKISICISMHHQLR